MNLKKKVFGLFICLLALPLLTWAQTGGPTITVSSATPCTDEEFCIDFSVEDFTDITSMKFPVIWDTAVVEFIRVDGLNLEGLTVDDFDITQTAEGLLKFEWQGRDCNTAVDAVTIADDVVIFRLCFRAVAQYGETTPIRITDDFDITNDPEPQDVRRLNVCDVNIGLNQVEGFVSTCVTPLEVYMTSTQGNPGDVVSVDVKSRGFRNLNTLQFSMNWDTNALEFDDVIPLENLVNLSIGDFGTPDRPNVGPGNLTLAWTFTDPDQQEGVDLADDLTIFTVNFRIKAACETTTEVSFSGNPTTVEAINTREENSQQLLSEVPILFTNGQVATGSCDPTGLLVSADCGSPVNLNDEVCIRITAGAISDISDIRYLMEWNPNILQFKNIRSLNTIAMPGLSLSDFNTNNTANGVLEFDWESAGSFFNANFAEGDLMYEVCFDVVGLGGNSPIRFDPPPNARVIQEGSIRNIGIFPSNCEVVVNQPQGVTVAITSNQAPPGDTICLDVTANNFQDLVDMQFSMSWEPNHAQFAEIKNVNPALAANANFGTAGVSAGSLTFDWEDPATPTSLAPDEILFTLCLEVSGDAPGELSQETNCQAISIVDFPLEGQAISSSSNGNNIGVTPVEGEICVLNPEGFFLVIENEEAFRNTETCVEFKVAEFDDITSAQFTLNWDPTLLRFSGNINLDAIPSLEIGTNLDTTSASVGIIGFDWNEPAGLSLPDSAVIFDVCFELIGEANNCADIEINSEPNPSVTTINGAGSVFPIGGGVCIKDTLIIVDSLITAVTCPGGTDGTIELTVEGGSGEVFYTWRAISSTQFLPKAVNLPVGQVAVTVFDNSVPALVTRDTFFIPLADNLPTASAGPDLTIDCETGFRVLNGVGTPSDVSYRWSTLGGNISGPTDLETTVVNQAGTYILSVIDNETGCAARDTLEVLAPSLPNANAGPDVFFTCADTLRTLDASSSTPLDTNVTYQWTAFSGGLIEPGDEMDVANPRVRTGGIYALEVRFKDTGCSATDTVEAISVIEVTPVSAGDDIELGCDTLGVTLFSEIDNSVRDFNFEWFDEQGNSISSDDRVSVNQPGLYRIVAEDRDNLCTSTDTVRVLPNSSLPMVDLVDSTAIDCNTPVVVLNAQVSNTDSFTISWSALDGGVLDEDMAQPLSPTVTMAGTFVLTIVDTTNSCTTIDTVNVANNIEIIPVDAGIGGEITCQQPSLTLNATVDTSLQLVWTLGEEVLNSDTDTLEVTGGGTYFLTATNLETGCANRDSVEVTSSADLPTIDFPELPSITCESNEIEVTANITPADATYNFAWTAVDGGQIVNGNDNATVTIGSAGTFQVEVTNTITGCVSMREVVIPTDTVAPIAIAGDDLELTCTQDTITLSGLGSAEGSTIVYTWSATDGGSAPLMPNSIQTEVTTAGTYMLEVRDTVTGCSSVDMVVVSSDVSLPNVQIATPGTLTCQMNMITLDGSGSDGGTGFSATWNPLAGQMNPQTGVDPLQATITDAGDYELVVTNLNTGCSNSAIVSVPETRELPNADAGENVIITCPGNSVSLDGSGSDQGDFSYQWSTTSGVAISNPTSLAPSVSQPGQFELVVTNNQTGCSNSATVEALLDPNLTLADAGQDDTTCDSDAAIFAVAPAGATGVWTTSGAATIDIPDGNSSTVGNLQPGANIFVWTLSTSDCPNYSTDSVIVTREQAPAANADAAEVEVGATELIINVTANDIITGNNGATVSILNGPTLGTVDGINGGNVTYRVARGVNGDDSFTYEVCNTECQTLCDTANVSVVVPFDPNYTPTLVNGITPNGDGQNDALIFESLEIDPDAFPDNELIIFNRWGDIVFQAQPYTNNWQGTNSSGEELPEGTYYYILRLDISEGNILKGDITIIK